VKYILYIRRFGSLFYCRLHVTGCHYTDTYFCDESTIVIKLYKYIKLLSNFWINISFHSKKLRQSRNTPMRRRGERRYSSYSFSSSALDGGVSGQRHAPASLYPRARTPGTRCTGGPQRGSGHRGYRKKILCFCRGLNLDRPVGQPVARHCSD
jgi:hypothetical protein